MKLTDIGWIRVRHRIRRGRTSWDEEEDEGDEQEKCRDMKWVEHGGDVEVIEMTLDMSERCRCIVVTGIDVKLRVTWTTAAKALSSWLDRI